LQVVDSHPTFWDFVEYVQTHLPSVQSKALAIKDNETFSVITYEGQEAILSLSLFRGHLSIASMSPDGSTLTTSDQRVWTVAPDRSAVQSFWVLGDYVYFFPKENGKGYILICSGWAPSIEVTPTHP